MFAPLSSAMSSFWTVNTKTCIDVQATASSTIPHARHRSNSSLGNHLDLVNRMASRYGSMGYNSDSDSYEHKVDKPTTPGVTIDTVTPLTLDTTIKPGRTCTIRPRRKSAVDEMEVLKMEREALEKAFDQCIDPDENGDVDIDEWFLGIQKLNVQLTETQQREVYKFMDKDQSGFIEKNDFVMFVTARFDTEELQNLQLPLLQAVRVQNLHDRTHSNLICPTLSQDWTDYDMELLQHEMASAMTGMVSSMKNQLTEEQEFKATMERRLEEDPSRLEASNAANWTQYEVVSWIEQIGMERYARYFAQENVDGPMLLEDMTQDMLESNLGMRSIHAKKMMREIYGLKQAIRGVMGVVLDESEFVCTHHIDDIETKILQLQIAEELDKTRREMDELKRFYENEMMKRKIVLPQPPQLPLDHSRCDSMLGIPIDHKTDEETSASDWSDDDEDLFGMTQAHLTQVAATKNGATPEQMNRFILDLRVQNTSQFCAMDGDSIMKWTNEEVAYWILSVGFEQYAFAFYALPIDGDMLIRDMNKESIIEDLGVMKIHSARILRHIDQLRMLVNEGFDEEVMDGVHCNPDVKRPTMKTIESLRNTIETLQNEREQIMQELEKKKNDEDGEESGYFTKKIQDLETERNELKENNEEIQTLNSSLHEANGSNDELRKEIRCMQKEMSRPKEIEGAKKHKKYEEFEALFKEERSKVQQLRKERQITAKRTNYVMWRNRTTIRCLIGMMILRFIIKWMMRKRYR
eukprot:818019_1